MKYLIITLFFCTFAVTAQEYDVYALNKEIDVYTYNPSGVKSNYPRAIVKDGYLFKVDSLGIRDALPKARIERNKIYIIDDFGVESYTPIELEIRQYLKRKIEHDITREKSIRK